jgi:hypothetical protein
MEKNESNNIIQSNATKMSLKSENINCKIFISFFLHASKVFFFSEELKETLEAFPPSPPHV